MLIESRANSKFGTLKSDEAENLLDPSLLKLSLGCQQLSVGPPLNITPKLNSNHRALVQNFSYQQNLTIGIFKKQYFLEQWAIIARFLTIFANKIVPIH